MILKVDMLNQQAYDILKEKIIKKELLPGTRLVDSQLAEDFGISRTPLRDAIRKLAEEGFVVNHPMKKGYYVYQPSAKDINEIFEMRLILDLAAATKLIREILPRDPQRLRILEEVYQAECSDEAAFVQKDEDFHDAVIRMCENDLMLAINSDLRSQTRAFRSVTSRDTKRMEKAHNYHQKIFQGFQTLDLEATLDAIRKHVEYSRADALLDYPSEEKAEIN